MRNPSPLSQGTGLVQTATNMNIMLQARTPCITSKSLLPRRFQAFHLLFFQFAFSLHNIMLQARTPCITSKSLLPRRFKAFHLLFFQFAFSLLNIMLQARTPCITSKSLLPRRFKAFHLLFFQFAFSLHALSKLGLHFPNPRIIRLVFRSSILEMRSHQQVENHSQITTERYPTWRKDFFTILIIVSAYLSINASSPVAVTASSSSWQKQLYHITHKSFIHPNHTVITPSASPPSLDSS